MSDQQSQQQDGVLADVGEPVRAADVGMAHDDIQRQLDRLGSQTVSIGELARNLGVKPHAAAALVRRGVVPGIEFGREVRVSRSAMAAEVKRRQGSSNRKIAPLPATRPGLGGARGKTSAKSNSGSFAPFPATSRKAR